MKGSLTVTRIPPGLGTQSSALSAPARVLGRGGKGDTAGEDAVRSIRTRGGGVSCLERKLGRGTPSVTLGTGPHLRAGEGLGQQLCDHCDWHLRGCP